MNIIKRIVSIFWRPADIAIGGADDPYLLRWFVIPRNPWFNIFLHKFVRDDDDRALHDHPWWFVSFLIWGRYDEIITGDGTKAIYRDAPSVAWRSATHQHRIVLPRIIGFDQSSDEFTDTRQPAWTIVITGPRIREWGFWCPQGFIHWRDFTAGKDGERIGKGCDQE